MIENLAFAYLIASIAKCGDIADGKYLNIYFLCASHLNVNRVLRDIFRFGTFQQQENIIL